LEANEQHILEILIAAGLINEDFAGKIIDKAEETDTSVVDVIADSGLLTRMEVIECLAAHQGMEAIQLDPDKLDPMVLGLVPPDIARRFRAVPVYKRDHTLHIAISDPFDVDTLDSLRFALKDVDVEPVVAAAIEIDAAIKKYYAEDGEIDRMFGDMTEADVDLSNKDSMGLLDEGGSVTQDDAPIIKLVSLIIMEAFRNRASDIHIEPMERELRVRYRIDGVLHKVESPPKRLQAAIVQRLKIMSNMQIAEKRIPQDGRIQINVMGRDLDLRVSTIPATHGESVVMRILDKEALQLGLPQLGFYTDDQGTFERMIGLSDGIILVTGPTGSGKTTTLYACLNEINKPDRKIITVEDPVEYQMSGINQVHVRADIGLTFSAALRSILRQAPNIIMIGEIRDLETAEIAVNASLTGHLVFSTLHTNDAPSAVTRLADIGVKPFLVASSLRAAIAQRLVRKICEKCKEPHTVTDQEYRLLGPLAAQLSGSGLYTGAGCDDCSFTGYKSRLGLFEFFVVNEEVQHMIYEQVSSAELRKKARELGMRTLREDGLRKVIAGTTTLAEVFRVTLGDAS
jgi:type IV pilus assembly protein PilB